jgi:RNA polymerase sigma factor (sigma-70 family)
MHSNETDIRLLKEDPWKLLTRYQPVIRIIVKNLAYQGSVPKREIRDLIQDVNRKLVERLPRIVKGFNGQSQFRTYFSVVIRNLCLEELRKVRVVMEPESENYEQTSASITSDRLLIRQEYERLQRALHLFGPEKPAIWISLRLLAELEVSPEDFLDFGSDPGPEERARLAGRINGALQAQKKDKIDVLCEVLNRLGGKPRNPESVRKWTASRLGELAALMNGNPPHAAYTPEILYILIEKAEIGGDN